MQVWYENVPFRYHLLPIYNSYLVCDPPGGVINRSKNLQMCVEYVKLRRIPPPVASLRVAPMFQSSHSSPTPRPRAQWELYNFGYANFERGAPLAPTCNGTTSVVRGPMVVPSMVVGCHMPPTSILLPRLSPHWLVVWGIGL